ncbi:RagB/SusD domain-containing protein (plasmid) [Gemmatirosa kalamazoonensis]|uniref:RagB/SusD domain-containing protein n=1 Tax=Gemmatirosa kalamazoonensis TaxID=861299 RepID=W0RT10_9BACT|nr:RagB/SusD family nutrient uptake outer membrane protein [Gemmatirosa kalamazoonensis]AHG93612.1 RagB/SusD domain-containing protein [Gemmatirosa kalamazoonensis]
MRLAYIRGVALAAAVLATAACDKTLHTEPFDRVSAENAVTDLATAQAALNGAYGALESSGMYGLDIPLLGDLPSDNGRWAGTYQFLGNIVSNQIAADNTEVTNMWTGLYRQIDRDNVVLATVPKIASIPDATKSQLQGEAYFLRALSYSVLVKFWGAVPTPTTPVASASEAEQYTRTPVAQVYALILSDLDKAAQLIPASNTNTRRATRTAVTALRSRVLFYRAFAGTPSAPNATDLQGALDAANTVLAGRDTLTVPYASLFTATGDNTSEDIFRVSFIASQSNSLGYYWLFAGRHEAEPSANLNSAYEAGDLRKASTVINRPNSTTRLQGVKYPTTAGTEHPHVIRLAELVLIKAEVLARQNNLAAAVAEYDKVRVRAGLRPHVLGTDVKTQADVLAAITKERRIELALEGDRWPDLVRQGLAGTVKSLAKPGYALFPIPLRDITAAASGALVQNPDY